MALDKRTLRRLRRQRRHLDRILAAQDAVLVDAWVRAWEELAAQVERAAAASVSAPGGAERVLRARRAMRIITRDLEALTARLNVTVGRRVRRILEQAVADQDVLIRSQLPTGLQVQFGRVDGRAIDEMVQRTTGQIEARSRALSASMVEQMRGELVRSVAVGINPRVAARQIVNRCQGVFDGGLARATVIARTEMLDAYRTAALESRKAAADVVTGWVWISALGPRTCPSCWAQHGSIHDLDEPGPFDHHQGRCTAGPVTKSWKDLGFNGIDEPASAIPDGEVEFAKLSEAQQREILGPKRFEAWQSGDYPMSQWSRRVTNGDWRDSYVTSPAPTGGGSGGGAGTPHTGLPGAGGDDWKARQAALGIETHGENLTPAEIEFVERFQKLGHQVEWIPRSPTRLPTKDFVWLNNQSLEVELKSTLAKYTSIRNHITRSHNKAASQGVTKDLFLIDLGDEAVDDTLRDALAGYNIDRSRSRIARLWVLSMGSLEEIALRET